MNPGSNAENTGGAPSGAGGWGAMQMTSGATPMMAASPMDANASGGNSAMAPAPTDASGSGGKPTPAPTGSAGDASNAGLPMLDPSTPLDQIPADCRGFEVRSLTTSPGGSVLPNRCAPFDGTFNNPYAIRCVDADPSYHTSYAGDEYCILPPDPNLGTQVHIGPSDYDEPGQFELAAGAETSDFYAINAPNTEAHYYYRTNWRMRAGGHHMLIALEAQDQPDGWSSFGDMGSEFGGSGKSFGGSQRPSVDRPQGTLDIPPENTGIGQRLEAQQQFSVNLHHINSSSDPILREVWINIWYVDDADVTAPIDTFAAMGSAADMSIAAGTKVELEYRCAVASDTRIVSMYGHDHAHNTRFGVWIERAAGDTRSIYESFNWEDIPVYQFDSISMNPVPDLANHVDGASSGVLMLQAGDELHFQCNIDNDSDQALYFADEAITGEMCILFAAYLGQNPCRSVERAR